MIRLKELIVIGAFYSACATYLCLAGYGLYHFTKDVIRWVQ